MFWKKSFPPIDLRFLSLERNDIKEPAELHKFRQALGLFPTFFEKGWKKRFFYAIIEKRVLAKTVPFIQRKAIFLPFDRKKVFLWTKIRIRK